MDEELQLELELVDLGDAKQVTQGDLSFISVEDNTAQPYRAES